MGQLNGVLKKLKKQGLLSKTYPDIQEIFETNDRTLFKTVTSCHFHVLQALLPPKLVKHYDMRSRVHDYALTATYTDLKPQHFLPRMIFKNIY